MDWVRADINGLKVYKESSSPYRIKLDANEGENILFMDISDIDLQILYDINRYPDSNADMLRHEISKYIGVNKDNIIAGNGSNAMIELVMKTFIESGDKVLSFVPTFGMYNIFSKIYNAEFIGVKSDEDFSLNMNSLIEKMEEIKPKLIMICNPNNPTGYLIPRAEIIKLLEDTDSLVIVDEAYIEFAEGSIVGEVENYKNLIVLRTFSKAIGLAGIRLGYMVSNIEIVNWVNKVKSPYNTNSLTQALGIIAMKKKDRISEYVQKVKSDREVLYIKLKQQGIRVYPSSSNFLFFHSDIKDLYKKLKEDGVLIRKFSGELEGYYRVTVGDRYENEEFIKSLKGAVI